MLAPQAKNPFAPKAAIAAVVAPPVPSPAPPPAEVAAMDVSAALEVDAAPDLDELVEQLLAGGAPALGEPAAEPRRPGGPGRMPGSPNKRKVLAYSHKALADAMILNPKLTGKELALIFDRTPQWVYLVKSSDAFQSYLERRQGELLDPTIKATLEQRAKAVAMRSMEVLAEKLDRPIDAIPDQFALRAFELTTKAAAIGGNAPPPPPPNPGEFLPELVNRLTALRGQASQAVDVVAREVPSSAPSA